jgi:hypothetical protein
MAAESIFQQAQILFQAGNAGSNSLPHDAADALQRQKALAIYQQFALHCESQGSDGKFSVDQRREIFEAIIKGDVPDPFNIETPEQAKALLILAHFDKELSRMVMEQQPLAKMDVRSAYRRILKHYHPDQTHMEITGEIIKKIQDAYSLLRPQL